MELFWRYGTGRRRAVGSAAVDTKGSGVYPRNTECRRRLGRKLRQLRCAPFRGRPQTPSQTAWALLGLSAAGDRGSEAVRRGVNWLLDRQKPDGAWDEELATGTGFPNVFYLNYHLYRHYFPILALASITSSDSRFKPAFSSFRQTSVGTCGLSG